MRALSLSRHVVLPARLIISLPALLELRRQRRRLAHLDAVQLNDIGLSYDAALAEARRPIWDAPPHWRL